LYPARSFMEARVLFFSENASVGTPRDAGETTTHERVVRMLLITDAFTA